MRNHLRIEDKCSYASYIHYYISHPYYKPPSQDGDVSIFYNKKDMLSQKEIANAFQTETLPQIEAICPSTSTDLINVFRLIVEEMDVLPIANCN
jgi:hypothetical protein